ncbi:hypothetical protein FQR65_LT04444 [Abscondita terminalis]|nr:hypothetical protein FQR65_LT04444 [Abscondita terminalis]
MCVDHTMLDFVKLPAEIADKSKIDSIKDDPNISKRIFHPINITKTCQQHSKFLDLGFTWTFCYTAETAHSSGKGRKVLENSPDSDILHLEQSNANALVFLEIRY